MKRYRLTYSLEGRATPFPFLLSEGALKEREARGIGAGEFAKRLAVISEHLGHTILDNLASTPIDDLSTVNQFCERTTVLAVTSGFPGFPKIAEAILEVPSASLSKPEPRWFQLLVGYALAMRGERPVFEEAIGGSPPKDIVLRGGASQVECRAFLLAQDLIEIWAAHREAFLQIKALLPEGDWQIDILATWDPVDQPRWSPATLIETVRGPGIQGIDPAKEGFRISRASHGITPEGEWQKDETVQMFGATAEAPEHTPFSMVYGDKRSVAFRGPRFDEFKRIAGAVMNKQHQLISGVANIVALDTGDFVGEVSTLTSRLAELFSPEHNQKLSAILLVETKAEPKHHATQLTTQLIENPYALVKLPTDLAERLTSNVAIAIT